MENSSVWTDFKKWWIHQGPKQHDGFINPDQAYQHHPLISSAMNVGNCIIAVIDIKTMMYIYTSPNYEEFSGWNKDDYTRGGVQFAFSNVHPSDQHSKSSLNQNDAEAAGE
jgi:hypothetical protein